MYRCQAAKFVISNSCECYTVELLYSKSVVIVVLVAFSADLTGALGELAEVVIRICGDIALGVGIF